VQTLSARVEFDLLRNIADVSQEKMETVELEDRCEQQTNIEKIEPDSRTISISEGHPWF
jgi:hypothetical protein